MGVADLLWACPECGQPGGIDPAGTCRCGVVFKRGRGASIRACHPDGRDVTRTPGEWVDRLPEPAALLQRPVGATGPLRQARVVAREATRSATVRSGGRFLNRIEVYGPEADGSLEIHEDYLIYRREGDGESHEPRIWPLEDLTAVQTSSKTLQIKVRRQPLVSFRFPEDSLFLWELLLNAALRAFYRRTGRGEIAEFQPRIVPR